MSRDELLNSTAKAPDRPIDPAVEAASRGRVVAKSGERRKKQRRGKKRKRGPPKPLELPPGVQRGAYSVQTFCAAHSISLPMFRKLRAKGLAPAVFYAGRRVLISVEAAETWRREREAAAAK